jgi:hypothetical protein
VRSVPVELTTIEAVPLIRVGTYALSTGERTFAEEDLQAAAAALATDPAVKAPRVKIDSVEAALGLDPTAHGGEPAFGYFDNLRVTDNGQTLVGDFHGPKAVADAMQWAYPSLSIEGTAPGWISATGRAHELVITAVALLGVHWPGVTTLDDFTEFLAEGPKIEKTEAPEVVLATMPQRPREIAASLDSDLVVRRFVDALDTGAIELPEGTQAWNFWPRALRFDDNGSPYLKVTDEASGRLYRVDVTVSGSEVTFGELVEVVEQDVPVTAAGRPAEPLASWSSRDEVRASVSSNPEEANPLTDEQRRAFAAAFGLTEDATVEQVEAAAASAAQAREGAPPPGEPVSTAEGTAPAPPPEPVAASAAESRTVTVTAAQWQQAQDSLDALRREADERRASEQCAHRDALVAAAAEDGRIAPSERQQWRDDLDAAPEATERILARLTPNRIPVQLRGIDRQEDIGGGVPDEEHERFMASMGIKQTRREAGGVTTISGGVN